MYKEFTITKGLVRNPNLFVLKPVTASSSRITVTIYIRFIKLMSCRLAGQYRRRSASSSFKSSPPQRQNRSQKFRKKKSISVSSAIGIRNTLGAQAVRRAAPLTHLWVFARRLNLEQLIICFFYSLVSVFSNILVQLTRALRSEVL